MSTWRRARPKIKVPPKVRWLIEDDDASPVVVLDDVALERLVRSAIQHVGLRVPRSDSVDEMANDVAFVLIASAHDVAAAAREDGDRLKAIGDLKDILDRIAVKIRENES